MSLPKIITPGEADNIDRPKPKRETKPSLLPEEIEEQVRRFLLIVNEIIKTHYRGAPILVPTGSLGNEALKQCEAALNGAGWKTNRTKDDGEWVLKIQRGEYGGRASSDYE